MHPSVRYAVAELTDLHGLLRELPDEEWDSPSACEGFRVRDVVAHLVLSREAPAAGGDRSAAAGRQGLHRHGRADLAGGGRAADAGRAAGRPGAGDRAAARPASSASSSRPTTCSPTTRPTCRTCGWGSDRRGAPEPRARLRGARRGAGHVEAGDVGRARARRGAPAGGRRHRLDSTGRARWCAARTTRCCWPWAAAQPGWPTSPATVSTSSRRGCRWRCSTRGGLQRLSA